MSWSKKFVELDKSIHERSSFDCGEVELNVFIRTKASKHMKAGISRTMVLPSSVSNPTGKHPVCAFYTLAPGAISRRTLPVTLKKKLPHYPVPVFLLAQLAVDSRYHGRGLGKITLIKALENLWLINSHLKAYAVITDCLNRKAETFYSKYGFEILCTLNGKTQMFLPMTTVALLFQK